MAYRALTEERTRCVDTLASPAKTSVLLTFVDVHANLHHRRHLEAFMATAGEASFGIDTRSVATDSVENVALVNIQALEPLLVQGKPLIAPATEGTDGVLAVSVLANLRKALAFIHIREIDIAVSLFTKLVKVLCARSGAL